MFIKIQIKKSDILKSSLLERVTIVLNAKKINIGQFDTDRARNIIKLRVYFRFTHLFHLNQSVGRIFHSQLSDCFYIGILLLNKQNL